MLKFMKKKLTGKMYGKKKDKIKRFFLNLPV
jgi:hypothetical protein